MRARATLLSPGIPPSVQTVEMCPAIFLSFGRRNWASNNSCCHAAPTAAKSERTKVMAARYPSRARSRDAVTSDARNKIQSRWQSCKLGMWEIKNFSVVLWRHFHIDKNVGHTTSALVNNYVLHREIQLDNFLVNCSIRIGRTSLRLFGTLDLGDGTSCSPPTSEAAPANLTAIATIRLWPCGPSVRPSVRPSSSATRDAPLTSSPHSLTLSLSTLFFVVIVYKSETESGGGGNERKNRSVRVC